MEDKPGKYYVLIMDIVRKDDIKAKPSYFLLGTLLSISFAILFGVLTVEALKLFP